MRFQLLDYAEDSAYIRQIRRLTLISTGLLADGPATIPLPPSTMPLPYAIYLTVSAELTSRPIGLMEAYFLKQAFRDFATCPYKSPSFENLCPFDEMVWVRTIYLDREHRRRQPYYLYLTLTMSHIFYLTLTMSHIFSGLGANYAGMTTRADDPFLDGIYRKSGGTLEGHTAAPFYENHSFAIYAFNVDRMLQHPRVKRISPYWQFDWSKIKAINDRKAPTLK